MMLTLQRITTEYIALEDRVRLSGELAGAGPVVIWLTQRLIRMSVPALLNWLQRQGSEQPRLEVVLGFAQQVARATIPLSEPVSVVAGGAEWLARSVELTMADHAVRLVFQGAPECCAGLVLEPQQLRQWLSILYEADRKAEWSLQVWPEWLRESALATVPATAVLH